MSWTHALTGAHLINGEWRAAGVAFAQPCSPETGEALPPVVWEAGSAEVEAAYAAASAAFEEVRGLPHHRWADLLEAVAVRLMDLGDALISRAMAETALTEARLVGELARTVTQLRLYADLARSGAWLEPVIDRADQDRKPAPRPDLRRVFRPVGPVAVFGAGNFPFAYGVCGGDTASALACGNPVVAKGHPGHAGVDELCAAAVLRALGDAGLPAGMFGLVQGSGTAVGAAVVEHPACEAVGFTGSLAGGRALFDRAAARPRPIPVFAEMGSVNPIVLLPGAVRERPDAIAAGLCLSVTNGGGQFCTKPGLVFLAAGPDADRFAEALGREMRRVAPTTLLSRSISDNFHRRAVALGGAVGVATLVAGCRHGPCRHGARLFAVRSDVWRANADLHAEAFGPCTLLVLCRDVGDLAATIACLDGQLTGAVFAGSGDADVDVRRVAAILERRAGRLIMNGYPTGVEVCGAIVHGGPYPATTAANSTSVGTLAIRRFVRPVCYQNLPDALLPQALQDANPLGLERIIDGEPTRDPIAR
ncbi:MAG: aldehyde dehydrogenase (NADP(+)) [Armatimonadetes bacterium]|nr:aldehyde dehydrogenase (NADP(+)) [Armatimonadota bacterium]